MFNSLIQMTIYIGNLITLYDCWTFCHFTTKSRRKKSFLYCYIFEKVIFFWKCGQEIEFSNIMSDLHWRTYTFLLMSDIIRFCLTYLWTMITIDVPISNFNFVPKLIYMYIPSTINIWNRCSPKPFGKTKNGLVSRRLACTSSKTEILKKIGI